MKRKLFQKFCHHLIGGAIILSLSFPSFSQGEIQKSEPLTINKIEVMKVAEGTRVFIEGNGPLEYTAFQKTKPLSLILDLPQAVLGKLAGSIQVQDGLIKSIQNKQITAPPHPFARVEIILEKPVEYTVDSKENNIVIDFGEHSSALTVAAVEERKTAEKKEEKKIEEKKEVSVQKQVPLKGKLIKEIQVAAQANFLEVGIFGTEPLVDFRSFRLVNPPRLVLDFPGLKNATGKRKVEVGSPWLQEIRLGEYPEKLRLVFTFPDKKIPPYNLEREEKELRVILGTKAETAPQVASLPEPVKLAQQEKVTEQEKVAEKEVKKEIETKEIKREEIEKPVEASPPAEKSFAQAQPPEKTPLPEAKPQGELEKVAVSPYKGAKISLDFKDADLHNIFRLLAEVSNLNIITTDDVKGKITIRMVNVPWDQVLDVILTTKNLVKIEEGNVLRITTAESVRKEREEKQKEEDLLVKVKESREKLEPLTTETITVNYAKAADLQKLIREKDEKGKGFLSPRGSVKADERTNTLIIQDTKQNIEEIINLIKKLDTPTPQVLIEARVVQAQTTFARSLGIQWGGSYNQTGGGQWHWGLTGNNPTASAGWGFTPSATGASTPLIMPSNFVVNFPASTGNTSVGGLGISFGKLTGNLVNLDLRLQLGETEGQTKVIARPKLATLTNTPAHIKQGELIPYETTSQAGTQVQFIDAVLMLEVTPQVTPDGSIKMTVKVTRDSRGTFRSPSMQVPSIDKREAKTEVLVKDGETLVIGGIYESENQESETRIPWLGKIPILGWLFKNKEVYNTKKELLIFITPTLLQGMKAES